MSDKKNRFDNVNVDLVYIRQLFDKLENTLVDIEDLINKFDSKSFVTLPEDKRAEFVVLVNLAAGLSDGMSEEAKLISSGLRTAVKTGPSKMAQNDVNSVLADVLQGFKKPGGNFGGHLN